MKIETTKVKTVYFSELDDGEAFWDEENVLYMKTAAYGCAVDLLNGNIVDFINEDTIRPANVKIVDADT